MALETLNNGESGAVIREKINHNFSELNASGSLNSYFKNVEDFGVEADTQSVTDGAMNSGSGILTSASGLFVPGDVGKSIVVTQAGAANIQLVTTIASYQSATQVTLTANAGATVTGKKVYWGTDDRTAWQSAVDYSATNTGIVLLMSGGNSYLSDYVTIEYPIRIQGISTYVGTDDYGGTGTVPYYGPIPLTTVITIAPNKDGFRIQKKTSNSQKPVVDISYLHFQSAGYYVSATDGAFIKISDMNQGSNIHHCSFRGGYYQVNIVSAFYYSIDRCFFNNPFFISLNCGNNVRVDTQDCTVQNNYFTAGWDVGTFPKVGIKVNSGGGMKIHGNKFDTQLDLFVDYVFNYPYKYAIQYVPTSATSDFMVTDNSIENYQTTGIYMDVSSGLTGNIQIIGNQIAPVSSNGPAIKFTSSIQNSYELNISGNQIQAYGGTATLAIEVDHATNVIIDDNQVQGYTNGVTCTSCLNVIKVHDPITNRTTIGHTPIAITESSYDPSGYNYKAFFTPASGTTTSDGFQVGIDLDLTAYLLQREAKPLTFYVNGAVRASLTEAGVFYVGPTEAAHLLKVTAAGIGSFAGGLMSGSINAPHSSLQSAGSFATNYVAKTGAYNIAITDHTVEVTSGTHNQLLPTAVGCAGRIYTITNSGTGTVTVTTTSSQTFVNVSGTPTTYGLAQFKYVQVQSNGANWLVIASN